MKWMTALLLALLTTGCLERNTSSDDNNTPQEKPKTTTTELSRSNPEGLVTFVQSALQAEQTARNNSTQYAMDDVVLESAEMTTSTDASPSKLNTSNTTVQEAGVDEQDILKVYGDKNTLYTLSSKRIKVLQDKDGNEHPTPYTTDPSSDQAADYYEAGYKYHYIDQYSIHTLRYDASGAQLTPIQKTDIKQNRVKGLYLYSTKLAAIMDGGWDIWGNWFSPYYFANQTTRLSFFDIESDGKLSDQATQFNIEGSLISSRSIGKTLYLVLRHYPEVTYDENDNINYEALTLEKILPDYKVNETEKGSVVDASNCLINEDATKGSSIITLVAIDTSSPDYNLQSECYVGSAEALYTSTHAMYIASTQWAYSDTNNYDPEITTDIHKFAFTEKGFDYKGSGQVQGHLGWNQKQKSFRFSEYNEDLRVITYDPQTSWGIAEPVVITNAAAQATEPSDTTTSTNNSDSGDLSAAPEAKSPARLTILREAPDTKRLVQVATLPNETRPALLGKPGEQLYATQFMGDQAFLVTYRLTDPLYVLNLADPTDPFIEGELEIDGWSDYLYPVGNDLLLGIGKDAIVENNDGREAAWYQGVKLSLVDISDPTHPTEIDKQIIGKRGSHSETLYDHHAYTQLNLENKTQVAIPIQVHETQSNPYYATGTPREYFEYSYTGLFKYEIDHKNKKITQIGDPIIGHQANSTSSRYDVYQHNQRSRIIGDSVHYLFKGQFYSQDWLGSKPIETTDLISE